MNLKPTRTLVKRIGLAAALAGILPMHATSEDHIVLFDFAAEPDTSRWEIVNDDVMGGVSTSQFDLTNGAAVFSGELSLENNGGFASVRTRPVAFPRADVEGFRIRVRGDGKRYRLTVRTENRWDAPLHQAGFTTSAGKWQEIQMPFTDFKASFRGRSLPDEPPLAPSDRVSLGFLIADEQEGPFRLEIIRIEAVRAAPAAKSQKAGGGD